MLIDGLVPAHDVKAAPAEIKPPDELRSVDDSQRRADVDSEAWFRFKQFDGTTLFPYPNAPKLNRLLLAARRGLRNVLSENRHLASSLAAQEAPT